MDKKSIGFLIDELITTEFKHAIKPTKETKKRITALKKLVGEYLNLDEVEQLRTISKQCWDAQEVVMKTELSYATYYDVAHAAKMAQRMNAGRNRLIRKIDEIVGEQVTVLPKTYGE